MSTRPLRGVDTSTPRRRRDHSAASTRRLRYTKSRGVTRDIRYWVAEGFAAKHARDPYALARVDQSVETEYETSLRYGCFAQREQQRRLAYQARLKRTRAQREDALERAKAFPLGDCTKLEEVFGVRA